MDYRAKLMTIQLLQLAQNIKRQYDQLEASGVRILPLEQTMFELINLILFACGINPDSESAAWLIEPIMQYIDDGDDMGMNRCLRILKKRLNDLKRDVRNSVGE